MQRLRLLLVVQDATYLISHRLPVAMAALAAGWDVHVAVPFEAAAFTEFQRLGLHAHDLPLRRGSLDPRQEVRTLAAIWRLVHAVKPDLLHAVSLKPILYAGAVARLLRVPALVCAITGLGHLFVSRDRLQSPLRYGVLRGLQSVLAHPNVRVLFQNPDDLRRCQRWRVLRPETCVLLGGCGVDLIEFQPQPEPTGVPVVLFAGRWLDSKGLREFVDAARLLRAQAVTARFVLAGRGDPENRTNVPAATIQAWVAEGVVESWGYRDDMPLVLAAAHVVCLPSHGGEGVPRSLIEAAACGRPLVASDVPGCREVVIPGETGVLVPPHDAPALAAALAALLADPVARQRMGGRARTLAETAFSVDTFVARTLAVYRELIPTAPVTPAGGLP